MSEQLAIPFPLAHRNDPITSYRAGERMVRTGKLNKQEREVLRACRDYLSIHDDFTAKDIAGMLSVGNTRSYTEQYFKVQRRFSGLRRKGYIERNGETRDDCKVWRLKWN